jgi:UDPglucose--hexose-1-phosphate uridylyltransferase
MFGRSMDKTEFRCDPLTQEWTIFNESRAVPPDVGSAREETFAPSPFRAGLERYAPHTLHHENGPYGWQVRVVPNRVPILRVEGDHQPNGDSFYRHLDGIGAHEIVIEDPGDRHFEDFSSAEMVKVLHAWRARIEDLMRDGRMRAFTVVKVKEVGRMAGQTVSHSLSQVFALAIVPPVLRQKLERAQTYLDVRGASIFADLIIEEQRRAIRVVSENASFLAFCPYASRAPFEVAVWPKRQCADFHRASNDELLQLAMVLREVLPRLNRALNYPPYQLTLTTAPSRHHSSHEWSSIEDAFRWHIAITPRLRPLSGFESVTGCHVNAVFPEVAADFLRRQEMEVAS